MYARHSLVPLQAGHLVHVWLYLSQAQQLLPSTLTLLQSSFHQLSPVLCQ